MTESILVLPVASEEMQGATREEAFGVADTDHLDGADDFPGAWKHGLIILAKLHTLNKCRSLYANFNWIKLLWEKKK